MMVSLVFPGGSRTICVTSHPNPSRFHPYFLATNKLELVEGVVSGSKRIDILSVVSIGGGDLVGGKNLSGNAHRALKMVVCQTKYLDLSSSSSLYFIAFEK